MAASARGRGPELAVRHLVIAALAAALLFVPAAARAEEPSFLSVGLGEFDIFHNNKAGDLDIEYRADRLWIIHPVAGAEFTTDSAYMIYGGFNFDVPLGKHFMLTFGSAAGHFSKGSGKDLGGGFQFRSGGEIAIRLKDDSRLGLDLHHISDAGTTKHNPGTEILAITYSIPIGHLFQSGNSH